MVFGNKNKGCWQLPNWRAFPFIINNNKLSSTTSFLHVPTFADSLASDIAALRTPPLTAIICNAAYRNLVADPELTVDGFVQEGTPSRPHCSRGPNPAPCQKKSRYFHATPPHPMGGLSVIDVVLKILPTHSISQCMCAWKGWINTENKFSTGLIRDSCYWFDLDSVERADMRDYPAITCSFLIADGEFMDRYDVRQARTT